MICLIFENGQYFIERRVSVIKIGEPLRNLKPTEIQKYQCNRYPMFYLDCVTMAVPGKCASGYKNFTYNEWFFPAHFEADPNVPGTIQIEALLQLFLMTFLTYPEYKGLKTADVALHEVRFKRRIEPGERLDMEAELTSFKRGIAKGISKGYVGCDLACELELEVAIPDILDQYKPRMKNNCVGVDTKDLHDVGETI